MSLLKKAVVLLVKVSLSVIFFGMVFHALYKLTKHDVGSRKFIGTNASFPSFTICPYMYKPTIKNVQMEQNATFEDVMNLPSLMDGLDVTLIYNSPYDPK